MISIDKNNSLIIEDGGGKNQSATSSALTNSSHKINRKAVRIIEWPEKVKKQIKNRLEITFFHESKLESRKIKLSGFGKWKNFKLNAI